MYRIVPARIRPESTPREPTSLIGPYTAPVAARFARWAAVGLLAVVLAFAMATARLFVWPTGNHPRHVDAIFILAGDPGERLSGALRLLRAGVSRTLVVDGDDRAW